MSTRNQIVKKQIASFLAGEDFAAIEVHLGDVDVEEWVRMRSNPRQFQPQIFVGSWADPSFHPTPGEIRLLRIMTGPDRVTRAIARQGRNLFCFPWM